MKLIFTLFLTTMLSSTQLLASVCTSKCSFKSIQDSQDSSEKKSTQKMDCHGDKSNPDQTPNEDSKNCKSQICQLDDFVSSDGISLDLHIAQQVKFISFLLVVSNDSNKESMYWLPTNGPPNLGPYGDARLFIQNSSYLI